MKHWCFRQNAIDTLITVAACRAVEHAVHAGLRRVIRSSTAALITLVISGCAGAGSGGYSPPRESITTAAAHRFLVHSTFGTGPGDIDRVKSLGYAAWIDEQLAKPASHQLPYLLALGEAGEDIDQIDRYDAFFQNALSNSDQLRQRIAFALSEIFVVSENSTLSDRPLGLAHYHDLLAEHAFGNYRELMEAVTLHPAMGSYLSMLGNEKPNPERNIRPDENYARELMQLFTIGLVQLNPDGTVALDGSNEPLPTYDQSVVEGFAQVFTGWTFFGSSSFHDPSLDYLRPMAPFADFHDTGPKKLLNGTVLAAGGTAEQDLEAALDNVFAHPNVGPFVARLLIQRLVTSNPSPAYVGRIAQVFNDNGHGVRGDLAAVVRALLLDLDARNPPASDRSGKLGEPLLRLTRLWRAYGASAPNGRYLVPQLVGLIGQAPLAAPSVFNFFDPHYAPPGEIVNRRLVAPEMQISTEFSVASITNTLGSYAMLWNNYAQDLGPEVVRIDISGDEPFADTPARLVTRVAERLTGGVVSAPLRTEAEALAAQYNGTDQRVSRMTEVLNLFLMSPEYALEGTP